MAEPDRTPAARTHGNTGHGHVWPRPDGMRARCGGPGLCAECSRDRALRDKHGEMPVTLAPDQTNAEVSDERLRELDPKAIEAVFRLMPKGRKMYLLACIMAGQITREEAVAIISEAIAVYLNALNRRSVTSQASEGEVARLREELNREQLAHDKTKCELRDAYDILATEASP